MIIRVESAEYWARYYVRKELLRRAYYHAIEAAARATALQKAEARLAAARNALRAFDKKHPQPTTEVPF